MGKSFIYTVDGGSFSKEQRQFYEDNGYIIFRKLIPDQAIDECVERFRKICNDGYGSCHIIKNPSLVKNGNVKGEYLINKIQDFLFDDVLFHKYVCNENLIDIVKNFTGPNISAMHSMLINKPPDSTYEMSVHPLHQDLLYFPFRPTNSIVASWTAMEKIHEQNGCLYLIPGSHKLELHPHKYPPNQNNKLYYGVQGYDHVPKVYCNMDKGDTIFFHPLILHGSGPNLTKGFRKAISVHFASSNVHLIDLKGTAQEEVAAEFEHITKMRGGIEVKYLDYWKIKSRMVCGQPGIFQIISSNL